MPYLGIVITGTSGSGKTIVSRKMLETNPMFERVKALTTRNRRDDDSPGEYEYISADQFRDFEVRNDLLINTSYRGERYGITKESLSRISSSGKAPLLVITPDSIRQLLSIQPDFISFFLDVRNSDLDTRLTARGEILQSSTMQQRETDRGFVDDCSYRLLNYNLTSTCDLISYLWNHRDIGGILPGNTIRLMMDWGYLVTDGDPNNITGAAYDLNLGDEYYYDGESHPLDDQHEFINLEPHEYVLVRSKETINLPKDIAARFGIKVGLFLQGLIQSNGPQIDPGFTGVLWCLLFNTSGDTVKLKRGKHYSTIEFCRLQSPTTAYTGEHLNHERIMQYLPSTPSRSPIKKLRDDVDSLQREGFWAKFGPLFFSLIIAAAALTMAILSYIKK